MRKKVGKPLIEERSIHERKYEYLTPEKIESSSEILHWLSQFKESQQVTAKLLLSHIKFIPQETYSSWLSKCIDQIPASEICGLYSVRKLDQDSDPAKYWDRNGEPKNRPGNTLGSEDLVYSLIAQLARLDTNKLDHPSLSTLREKKIRRIVLVDDSIGSGDRISDFINAMLNHPTFLSWWSAGYIRIEVLSYARQRDAEALIIANIRGSDHPSRRHSKSSKISFTSAMVYDASWLKGRWGENYEQIIELCKNQTKIGKSVRLGYGDVMANTVFAHGAPNNSPGILWANHNGWNPLMPNRAVPSWLLNLLDRPSPTQTNPMGIHSVEIMQFLALVKVGVRSSKSIAVRLCVDHKYAINLIAHAQQIGLLTPKVRLTKTALNLLQRKKFVLNSPEWDQSLYIPNSWCAYRETSQPLGRAIGLTDSMGVSAFMDGDVGQMSLEKSGAKATTSPISVMLQKSSWPQMDHDTYGPPGDSKDR